MGYILTFECCQISYFSQVWEVSVFARVSKPVPLYLHVLETLFFVGLTFGVSLTTNCLALVIEIAVRSHFFISFNMNTQIKKIYIIVGYYCIFTPSQGCCGGFTTLGSTSPNLFRQLRIIHYEYRTLHWFYYWLFILCCAYLGKPFVAHPYGLRYRFYCFFFVLSLLGSGFQSFAC